MPVAPTGCPFDFKPPDGFTGIFPSNDVLPFSVNGPPWPFFTKPSSSIIQISAIEKQSIQQGADYFFKESVVKLEKEDKRIEKIITDKDEYEADYVINAAGADAGKATQNSGAAGALLVANVTFFKSIKPGVWEISLKQLMV